jgi:hypothetical protein
MMTPKHQALLIAFFIQETLNYFGKHGDSIISKAIFEYGEGRGKRMADKALKDGRVNDLLSFLLYGEIEWDDTGNQFKIAQRKPFFKVNARKCFWHEIWAKNEMLEIGRIYCRDIDRAIMKGFNPNLNFDVPQNMNDGAKYCVFNYRDWRLEIVDLIKFALKKKKAKKKAVESWTFHCIDVYEKFSNVIIRESGEEGKLIIEGVVKKFTEKFGESATNDLIK